MPCRHCRLRRRLNPRGLCDKCRADPAIEGRYPVLDKPKAGIPDRTGVQPLPEPTDTLPHTPERLRVLEERAERGEQLKHPDDRQE